MDLARRKKGWNRQSTAWCQASLTSMATLKQFWRRQPIQTDSFLRIVKAVGIENWTEIIEEALPQRQMIDWGEAPDPAFFLGRADDLDILASWILQDHCKLVTLYGMGGIGKTTVAVKLVERIQTKFELILWRSLRNAPPLQSILQDLSQLFVGDRASEEEINERDLLKACLDQLRDYRCLIILDNAESILTPASLVNYGDYEDFFRRVGQERHQSCLILTSRELPSSTMIPANDLTRTFHIGGLSATDGQKLLRKQGSLSAREQDLQEIVVHYAGNPLALQMIATSIRSLFKGKVHQFLDLLHQGGFLFADLEDLLRRQFERLTFREQEVVFWLALDRELVSIEKLRLDLVSPESRWQLVATLESLQRQSIVEVTPDGLGLQPAMMDFVTRHFVDVLSRDLLAYLKSEWTAARSPTTLTLLCCFPLIKAQATDAIREAQTRLVLRPLVERLQSLYTSTEALCQVLIQLSQAAQGKPAVQIGYLGGNLFNLLAYLKSDLSHLDLSSLPLWQMQAQGLELQHINLQGTDLSKSVFTEVFSSSLSACFHPNGTLLATSDDRGWIFFWQVTDAKPVLSFQAHQEWAFALAFSPDGQLLASGSLDRRLYLWSLDSDGQAVIARPYLTLQMGGISDLAFSPDGHYLASCGSDRTIQITPLRSRKPVRYLTGHHGIVCSIAFNARGRLLASASFDGTIRLWDINRGQYRTVIEVGHPLYAVTFLPEVKLGRRRMQVVAAAGEAGQISLWDSQSGTQLETIQAHVGGIWSLAAHGHWLASAGDDQVIRLWDLPTATLLRTLQAHQSRIWSVAFSPDGQTLVSASEDQTIQLWTANGSRLRKLEGYYRYTWPLGFVQYAGQVDSLCTFTDHQLHYWDLQSGQCLHSFGVTIQGVLQAFLSPDQQIVACGSYLDYKIHLFDTGTGRRYSTLEGHQSWVRYLAFSPNGKCVASASGDQTVKVWNLATGELLQTLVGHQGPVGVVTFSSDGQYLISGSWDQSLRVWHLESGYCQAVLVGHTDRITGAASMQVDQETWIISGSKDQTLKIWSLSDQVCHQSIPNQGSLMALTTSPNQQLASASLEGQIKVWSWQGEQVECIRTMAAPLAYRGGLLFNADATRLVTGGPYGSCQVWDLTTHQVLVHLQIARPYEGLRIRDAKGLTEAQRVSLRCLGAVESD